MAAAASTWRLLAPTRSVPIELIENLEVVTVDVAKLIAGGLTIQTYRTAGRPQYETATP